MRPTTRVLAACLLPLVLIVAGCSDDDDEATSPTSTTATTADSGPSGTDRSIEATATPAPGKVTITASVEGVEIKPADGDTTGSTGHLHLFVDREPSPAGEPIPNLPGVIHTPMTTIEIPDLAAGEHTVHVVVGNGAHFPVEPALQDSVTFTVPPAA